MKLELNTDKSAFCTIGFLAFSFATPQIEVNLNELPDNLKKQISYNITRGVLKIVSGRDELVALVPPDVVPPKPVKQQEAVRAAQAISRNPMEENLQNLRNLLRQTVPTIKKEATGMSASQIRKLVDLEKETKKRKALLAFFQERLDLHEANVRSLIGTEDLGPVHQPDWMTSTQVTDVVESEQPLITFKTPEQE